MRLISTLAIAAALGLPAAAQGLKINPGEWEYTTEMTMVMDMNGQKMNMPAQVETESECVTEEDATFTVDDIAEEGCEITDLVETSSSLSFKMACAQDGMNMTGSVDVKATDGGNGTSASIVMNGNQPGVGTIDIDAKMTGKRIGACS